MPVITRLLSCFMLFSLSVSALQGQIDLSYYLPETESLNPAVTSPEDFLGFQIGDWHVSHDQQTFYMKQLAAESDRVRYEVRGYSHENRPMVHMIISDPENLERLEEIKSVHRRLSDIGEAAPENTDEMPVVVWLGYSIHGNEASGANAAMLVAYYLAAGQSEEISRILENAVIIFYPSFNPDGMQRFSTWVNINKGKVLNPDPQDREYHERWPNGRTNHYGFDLNRDWLPVSQPESESKIELFQEWRPNILTDHHEMGTEATYFFQPGIPSRTNPMTPDINQELTEKIAEYHVEALDKIGSLYYARESFDDFYYGKGSTYPDIQGSVGILFEQASSRGHIQNSPHGALTFAFAIRNHFTTSFSTLRAAVALKAPLLEYQRDFYRSQDFSARSGYIFGSASAPYRTRHLARLLQYHDIEIYETRQDLQGDKFEFSAGESYFVPLGQRQQQLIRTIFETNTDFQDSLFYDVSTWTLPLAYGLPYEEIDRPDDLMKISEKVETEPVEFRTSDYAYVVPWTHYLAPKVLYALQKEGVRIKVATSPFTYQGQKFDYGSLLIPLQNQDAKTIENVLRKAAREDGVKSYAFPTGWTEGVNLGSRTFLPVRQPRIAMITGEGASPYTTAGTWHLLDTRYEIPVSRIEGNRFSQYDLNEYNILLLADSRILDFDAGKIKRWLSDGGILITIGSSGRWAATNGLGTFEYRSLPQVDSTAVAYDEISALYGARVTGGSIIRAKLDRSHPICFGYEREELPVFKNNNYVLIPSKLQFKNPVVYSADPLWSGYLHAVNGELFSGGGAVQVASFGKGRIINFADDPNFRAFWYGTNRLFANALFFGNLVSTQAAN